MEPKTEGQAAAGVENPAQITLDELDKRMQEKINALAASWRGARAKDTAAFQEALAKSLEPVMARLSAMPESPAAGERTPEQTDAVTAKYEAAIRKLTEKAEAAERARAEQEQRAATQEERTALTQLLSEAGIEGARLKAAVALLYAEEKRVARTQDGAVGMRVKRDYGDDIVPIGEGVKEWLSGEDAKAFLPAVGAAGSGAGMPGRPAGRLSPEADRNRQNSLDLWKALGGPPLGV
jgi:hypothetical protein